MKYIAPNFHKKFRCIAGKCRHTCCADWEIDIDNKTLNIYHTISGAFGQRLADNIEITENGAFFRLDTQERCPFLNQNGLCDIILTLGEDALCQICQDHPRFRNFFSNRTEIGLGLCCEAAGTLLLGSAEKMQLIELEISENLADRAPTEAELDFFAFRDELFHCLQNREYTIAERLQALLLHCEITLPQNSPTQWAEIFLRLERLDITWERTLHALQQAPHEVFESPLPAETDTMFEQLAVYFVYRHLAGALEDGLLAARAAFSVLSVQMIMRLCQLYFAEHQVLPLTAVVEFARLYSSEIEYSQENMDALLTLLQGEQL